MEEQEEKEVVQTFFHFQQWLNSFLRNSQVDILKVFKTMECSDGCLTLLDLLHVIG